jgi:RNA polymerase sigma-70 factor (ECF subfamily)
VYYVLNDEEEAKDVTQQSFLILFSYRDVQSMSLPTIYALLKSIAKNQAIDYFRKAKLKQKYINSSEAKMLQSYETIWACEELLAEESEYKREVIVILIPRLPDRQKEIFSLRFYDSKTALEISELLKISFHTVNNTLTAAKENLRKMYDEYRSPK